MSSSDEGGASTHRTQLGALQESGVVRFAEPQRRRPVTGFGSPFVKEPGGSDISHPEQAVATLQQ